MGHLVTPPSKHDYIIVDYWGVLCRTDYISDYNWCEYAMNFLLDAIKKAQQQIESNSPVIYLYGCHFFLQVSYYQN